MNLAEASRELKLGWVAEATTATGFVVRMWGRDNMVHHVTHDFPQNAEHGYGTGYGLGGTGVTLETVFIVRQETIEELHARYVRAGLGGE